MDAMFKSPFELISKSFDISKKPYAEKEIPPGQTAVGEITARHSGVSSASQRRRNWQAAKDLHQTTTSR
jgi:hypothetical protein